VGTGKVFHYINGKFEVHQRVYQISQFSERVNGYFFYLYFSTHFYKRIMQMTAKSSVDSVRKEMIGRMQIPLPPTKAEQTAIAEVLSDMDAEIAALEARREKTRALKQAMMQELLTGRTRLIVPASESNATASPQPESPKTENRKSRSNGAHPEAQDAVLVS
jgi:type I restriction enzyme S subunit